MWEFKISYLLLFAIATDFAASGDPRGLRLPRGPHLLRKRDITYSTSLRDPTANAQFGATGQLTTVNAGVTRWLSGLGTHNFYGNLNNYGQIIISQTDWLKTNPAGGQTSDFVGHTTTNGNLYTGPGSIISLNDFGSSSAPTYDWYLRTLTNYGALQMCGRGDTGGSTYQLYCDIDCYNYGLIDMGQYYGNLGASYVWRNAALYPPGATTVYNTYNEGTFRITNLVYHNVQNVLGTGCYIIGSNGTLYLEDGSGYYQNTAFGPTFPNQAIYFTDGSGDLHMDTQVYSHNSNFGPQVYGFGAGNAIEFYEIFPTSNVFTYDGTAGTLTVRLTSGNSVIIKIGVGYDASLFFIARNPTFYNTAGYNAIFYRGAAPAQSVPTKCQASVGTCADPESTAGVLAQPATTTVGYSGTGTFSGTSTTTIAASGTARATIAIITAAPYNTATTFSNGVSSTYTTTVPQVGTAPGTILIVRPASYATTTSTSTGAVTTATTTFLASGTSPGTVVVIVPAGFVIATTTSNVPAALTTTIPASGTAPGTILVIAPAAYATSTSASDGLAAGYTTTVPASNGAPGTILVVTPASYVGATITSNVPSAYTTVIRPSGTTPGTILVVKPASTSATISRPSVLTTTLGPNQCVCRPRQCGA